MSGSGIIESDAPVDNTAYGRENGEWVATFAAEEMNLFVQQVNTNAQVARSAELAAKDAAIAANNAVNLVQREAQNVQIARNAAEAAASNAAGSQKQANADALATQNALLATQQIKTDVQTLRDSAQNAATAASSSAAEALEQARVILADPARITDAPADGHRYARVNREWVKLPEPYKLIKEQPSDMWFCPHNLGKIPRVSVFSLGGVQVEAEIEHPTENMTVVKFTIPFAGYVICET